MRVHLAKKQTFLIINQIAAYNNNYCRNYWVDVNYIRVMNNIDSIYLVNEQTKKIIFLIFIS